MPKLDGILETAIHTEDIVRARAFYEGVLGLDRSIATTGCPLCGDRTRCPLGLSQGHHEADRCPVQRDHSRPWW